MWKPITDFPGYEVSDEGAVRRVARSGHARCRDKGLTLPYDLSPTVGTNGYRAVGLYRNNKVKRIKVARLVARAFLGDPPSPKHHAAHRNGVRTDDRAANLYWATVSENTADKWTHGTMARGERVGCAVLTEPQIIEIRSRYSVGDVSQRALAREYGVAQSSMWAAIHGRNWGHV